MALARVKHLVSHSLQVSGKVSGQHVTTVTGTSRYSFGVLADKGFGDTDLTANLLYTRTAQRRADPAEVALPSSRRAPGADDRAGPLARFRARRLDDRRRRQQPHREGRDRTRDAPSSCR